MHAAWPLLVASIVLVVLTLTSFVGVELRLHWSVQGKMDDAMRGSMQVLNDSSDDAPVGEAVRGSGWDASRHSHPAPRGTVDFSASNITVGKDLDTEYTFSDDAIVPATTESSPTLSVLLVTESVPLQSHRRHVRVRDGWSVPCRYDLRFQARR
jgi:hypothetical protein